MIYWFCFYMLNQAYTNSPCLITIHSATFQNFDSAEWMVFTSSPWYHGSCSASMGHDQNPGIWQSTHLQLQCVLQLSPTHLPSVPQTLSSLLPCTLLPYCLTPLHFITPATLHFTCWCSTIPHCATPASLCSAIPAALCPTTLKAILLPCTLQLLLLYILPSLLLCALPPSVSCPWPPLSPCTLPFFPPLPPCDLPPLQSLLDISCLLFPIADKACLVCPFARQLLASQDLLPEVARAKICITINSILKYTYTLKMGTGRRNLHLI